MPSGLNINDILIIILSFFVLTKSAEPLVDGAVGIARAFKIPKIIIGIVLVSLATTAPEFTVTLISALKDQAGMAFGNAIGSVIADDALALALGILVAPTPFLVNKKTVKTSGIFLIAVCIIAFVLAADGNIVRWEGIILLILMGCHLASLFILQYFNRKKGIDEDEFESEESLEEHLKAGPLWKQFARFIIGVVGIIMAGKLIVDSASAVAVAFHVSDEVIGRTIVAIGTSLPEIATCIVAARKGHGDLAFGDIIGADILNLLWIIGTAATAKGLEIGKEAIFFNFPFMMVVVLTMLGLASMGWKFQKWKGGILLSLYALFFIGTILLFIWPPGQQWFSQLFHNSSTSV